MYAPCTIGGTCTQIPVSKGVCEDNNGIWWGPGHDDPATEGIPEDGFDYCCEVTAHVVAQSGCTYGEQGCGFQNLPLSARAVRNSGYKLIVNVLKDYVSPEQPCYDHTAEEFYEVDEQVPVPDLDNEGDDLLAGPLTAEQQAAHDELSAQLTALLASEPSCPGDGNLDLVVDQADLDEWATYAAPAGTGGSSVYDFDIDGDTDTDDRAVIDAHLGNDCRP